MASFKIENICACSLLKVLSFSVRRCSDSSRCAACCVPRYCVRSKGCAAGLVFMCVSRASLACCDCYPQRLFGKLGAATAVSGFRAKELDPIIGVATATRFTRESKRRLPTTHVWATRKYRRARSSPSATLWAAPSDINDALLAAGAAEER